MLRTSTIRRLLAAVIILSCVSLAGGILLKMYRPGKQPKASSQPAPAIELSLKDIHYTETRDGEKKWDLYADKADYDKVTDITRLNRVRLVLMKNSASNEITVTADQAEYHNTSKDVRMSGHVIATDGARLRFTTDTLAYSARRSLIETDDRISFIDGPLTVQGRGMVLTTTNRNVRVLHDVTAMLTPGKR